ncbi:MAG: exosortase/archaeosortase family protein [Methylacidiphilales bacterium]|nr:exosortase/archaeosortase family protein [Candidatus Methylacidiphilales bacterium]
MTSVTDFKPADSSSKKNGTELPWAGWICLLLAGVIVLHPLSYTWNALATYAFGWWVPLLALILCSERWSTRPVPESSARPFSLVPFILIWSFLFLCFRLPLESSFASRPLLTACTFLYLGALFYWLSIYGGKNWIRHFAFPVLFLLLCVPWPTAIEMPLVQGLERINAWLVAQFLVIALFIPAQANANIIALPHSVLGIEEACSGVRSLQAAIMIGFLLGELYRFVWSRRLFLVGLAITLALFGNFLRTLFLALLAYYQGISVMNRWHDSAGAFILIFTSVTIWLLCHFLHRRRPHVAPAAVAVPPPPSSRLIPAQRFAVGILIAAFLVEAATEGWYAWKERHVASYPTWTALAPAPGRREIEIPKDTSDLLKYDFGRQVEWTDEQGWDWTAYWFRYHPNPWGAAVFQSHNPDQCLPAIGYKKIADEEPFDVQAQDIRLRVWPEVYLSDSTKIYVFWMVYGNRSNFPVEQAVLQPYQKFSTKFSDYLASIYQGRRGSTSEMESLEVVIAGPADYTSAKAAYLAELPKMIVPDTNSAASEAKATAHP